jgi:hypothetical protein
VIHIPDGYSQPAMLCLILSIPAALTSSIALSPCPRSDRVEKLEPQFLDRASFEKLFGLKRCQAILLIKGLAGGKLASGRNFAPISSRGKATDGETLEWVRERRKRGREKRMCASHG